MLNANLTLLYILAMIITLVFLKSRYRIASIIFLLLLSVVYDINNKFDIIYVLLLLFTIVFAFKEKFKIGLVIFCIIFVLYLTSRWNTLFNLYFYIKSLIWDKATWGLATWGRPQTVLQVCNQVYEQFYDDNGIFKIDSLDEFGLFGEGMKRSEREIRSYR